MMPRMALLILTTINFLNKHMTQEHSPEYIMRMADYYTNDKTWGSLHVVLNDNNFDDQSLAYCLEHAKSKDDKEGVWIAQLLQGLNETERRELRDKAEQASQDEYESAGIVIKFNSPISANEYFENGTIGYGVTVSHFPGKEAIAKKHLKY